MNMKANTTFEIVARTWDKNETYEWDQNKFERHLAKILLKNEVVKEERNMQIKEKKKNSWLP